MCYLKFNMMAFQHSFVLSWKHSQVATSGALPDKSDEIIAPDSPQVTAGVWGAWMCSNYPETRLFRLSMAVSVPLVLCCANLGGFIQVSRFRDCRAGKNEPSSFPAPTRLRNFTFLTFVTLLFPQSPFLAAVPAWDTGIASARLVWAGCS